MLTDRKHGLRTNVVDCWTYMSGKQVVVQAAHTIFSELIPIHIELLDHERLNGIGHKWRLTWLLKWASVLISGTTMAIG